jgi:autotransporter-associated beta strand protein
MLDTHLKTPAMAPVVKTPSRSLIALCALTLAATALATASPVIDAVYFAQTHVAKADHPYSALVGNKNLLIKAHVVAPGGIAAPPVSALLSLDGQTLNLPLTGPAILPTSIPDGPGVVQHAFANSFTGTIPKAWVKSGLTVTVKAGTAQQVIGNLNIGAPTKVIMTMFDVHYFGQASGNYPAGWENELLAKWPAAELEVRRTYNVVFPELVIPPRAGVPAARVKSRADYTAQTGLAFDGEQGAALAWNGALRRAAGTAGRISLYYTNIYGVGAGGQAGGFAGVGNGTSVGILHHELGHALSLPHWGDSSIYPYKGDMHGIPAPAIYNGTHAGPTWAFDPRFQAFIPCTTQPGNVGNRPVGTYKADPMQGGGTGFQEPPYLMNHFADFSVMRMRNYLQDQVVVWNQQLGQYARWNQTARDYTTTMSSNAVTYPVERDVPVISILASVSGSNPGVNMAYPPIGPYSGGLIRLFDPRVAADRTSARSIYSPTGGCDVSVRVIQGGAEKIYMLAAAWEPSIDPLSGSSLRTAAVNLPAGDGAVTRIELLLTPDADVNGLPANPQVLYTWPADLVARPSNLVATGGNGKITLGWTASPNATGYRVKRSLTSGGPYTQIATTTSPGYVDTNVLNSTTYHYVVTATNSLGESDPTAEASATAQPPPAAPSGLVANPGDSVVSLSWSASSGATGYVVKRSSSPGGPFASIQSVQGTLFDDVSVVNGASYYYVVAAINGGGEGPNSQVAGPATPQGLPSAPSGLVASAGDQKIVLAWNAAPGTTGYLVKRSFTPGGPHTTIQSVSGTGFTDLDVSNGTTYYYVVAATNEFGASTNSAEAFATPTKARFWDGGAVNIPGIGDGASGGGAGTWNTTLLNWDSGAGPYVAWANAANDTAIFGGTAGTVTIGSPVVVGGLQFETAGYTLTGDTLTFGSAGIIATETGTATVASQIAGGPAAAITKQGMGTLSLTAANSYAGDTIIEAGTLRFATAAGIGGSGRSVVMAEGSAVELGFAIDNAFLNRLKPTENPFRIILGTTSSNPLDLGGETGAVTPNVTIVGNGSGSNFTGTLATSGDTYRFRNQNAVNNFSNANLFTVSSVLSNGTDGEGQPVVRSVEISGVSPVYLTGASPSYTGTTTVAPGAALGFDQASVVGLAIGSIIAGENASLLRRGGNLDNSFLQRIATTENTITIYANNASSGSALDLSGTNGGTYLPKASLATWDNVGTVSFAFTGTITPADNTYRFGGPRAANFINLNNTNSLTGNNALMVVPGSISRLRLNAANDFTGDTTVHSGTLFLTHNLALQKSAINTTGAGVIDLGGTRPSGSPTPVTTPIIGGLKGGKNINAVFNSSYSIVTSLTLNSGTGVTHAYSGVISNGAPDMTLIKTGSGSQILTGVNTYTGGTTVEAGRLIINSPGSLATGLVSVTGGTLGGDGVVSGPVTVGGEGNLAPGASVGTLTIAGNLDISALSNGGGRLEFELVSPGNHDQVVVEGSLIVGNGTFGFDDFEFITGEAPQSGIYQLITTTGGISGTLDNASLAGEIDGRPASLQINGNDLELLVDHEVDDYTTWVALFPGVDLSDPNGDLDGDGLTHNEERIWGLDPTSSASANPISIPLDAASGTVSYTRRDPALTRINYTVWTSSDLVDWTEDSGAIQTPGANDENGVQAVEVALSPALLGETRLFVRIRATE